MSRFQQFRLVVGREVTESFRRTSVKVLIGILFVAAVAGMILPEVVGGSGRPDYDVHLAAGVAAEVTDRLDDTAESAEVDVQVVAAGELEGRTPREALREGDIDAAVLAGSPPMILTEDDRSDRLVTVLAQAVSPIVLAERLEQAGVDPDESRSIATAPSVRFETVSTDDDTERRGVGSVASIVLYFAILTVAMQVANGTAIEKASRISEVLLAVVRPGTLLFGKVVGVGLVSLAGVVALVVPVLVKAVVGGTLPASALPTIGVAVAWFVLGVAVWAPLAGMFGSMVERQEEVGTALQPMTLILVGAFLAATSVPDSPVGTALALVPLTSPIIEPTRVAMGVASVAEVLASAGLLVLGSIAAVRLGGIVHRRAVVRTGSRLRFRDVF